MGKSKRNTPKPDSNRAAKLAERRGQQAVPVAPERPFAGLAAEGDLIALREFVPSALAPVTVAGAQHPIFLATVLPGAVAAMVREEAGQPVGYVGLQVQGQPADLAGSLAAALGWVATAPAGEAISYADPEAAKASLADLIGADTQLEVTLHNDFAWWVPAGTTPSADLLATIERAADVIMPSARIAGDQAAWWVDAGAKGHVRIVRPEAEDELMAALARVHAAGELNLGDGSRFAGSFRVHGVLVPVFDVDTERHPDEWTEATASFGDRLAAALAVTEPLTSAERRSRDGIRGRQVTLR